MNLPHFKDKKTGAIKGEQYPRLWVYNYDFEFELAGEPRHCRDQFLFHPWYFLNRSWHVLLPLSVALDEILVYEEPHPSVLDHLRKKTGFMPVFFASPVEQETNAVIHDLETLELDSGFKRRLCPWGWSPNALLLAKKAGLLCPHEVDSQTVHWLNAKTTSHRLREERLSSSFQIPGRIINAAGPEAEDPAPAIVDFLEQNGPSFVKHPFGTAGRLSDRCENDNLSGRKIRKWKNWIHTSGEILLEKAVPVEQEWSVQAQLNPEGSLTPIALTRLFSGPNGNYQGTLVVENDQQMLNRIFKNLAPVLTCIAKKGFVGPLGIDLIETGDGTLRLLEINGRLTMGRVAYEWHRLLSGSQASLFTNLFIQGGGHCDTQCLVELTLKTVEAGDPEITLLNLVADKIGNRVMVSLLMQGDKPKPLIEAMNRLKPRLKKAFLGG